MLIPTTYFLAVACAHFSVASNLQAKILKEDEHVINHSGAGG
jgi:hypothetical protein